MNLLNLVGVKAGYGKTQVLSGLDLSVQAGESISIIGRNGVGKTTLLRTLIGVTDVYQGQIDLEGKSLGHLTPYQRIEAGLGYVPQEREIFPSLTVHENLAVAQRAGRFDTEAVYALFPGLAQRRKNMGNQLSGGEQQMLAIARALVCNPRLLLMDEPSEGLAPVIVDELAAIIARLRDEYEMTILLVEQNSRIALAFAERCLVMNRGRIIQDGPSQVLRDDSELLERLIGVDAGISTNESELKGEQDELGRVD